MKAVYLLKNRKIEVLEIPAPDIVSDDDVLVAVKRVGICASDVHYYKSGRIGSQVVEDMIVLGHEASGEVVECGRGVKSLKKGQKVAIDPAIYCKACESCIKGYPNLCPNVVFFGTPPVDGAIKEFVVMPEENLFPIPEGLTLDDGVLSEPLAIGLYGVRLSGIMPGDDVSISGAGPIGLSVIFSVKLAGAGRIFVSDLIPGRLDMAKRLGADRVVLATDQQLSDVVMKETEGRGVDISYEAAGKAETVKEASETARIGGKTVIYGIPDNDRIEFNASVVRRKQLTVINVRRQAFSTGLALEMMAKKQLPFSDIATHRFPIEQTKDALDIAAEYRQGVIKAIIEVSK